MSGTSKGARDDGRQRREWQRLQFAGGLQYDPNNQQVIIDLGKGLELDGTGAIQADLDAESLVFNANDIRVLAGEGIQLSSGVALDFDGLTEQTDPGFDDFVAIYDDGLGAHRKVSLLELAELLVPPGTIRAYAAQTAPAGYLLCEGGVVAQATYPKLFAVIGTTFNTGGEGGGNFRLPNIRQRVIMGHAASGTGSTFAGTGGSIDHTHLLNGTLNPGFGDCIDISEEPFALDSVVSCLSAVPVGGNTDSDNQAFIALKYIIKT